VLVRELLQCWNTDKQHFTRPQQQSLRCSCCLQMPWMWPAQRILTACNHTPTIKETKRYSRQLVLVRELLQILDMEPQPPTRQQQPPRDADAVCRRPGGALLRTLTACDLKSLLRDSQQYSPPSTQANQYKVHSRQLVLVRELLQILH
jgi:hypothetical protein